MSATDIVVVGAGVVGCAVAFELARRGAAVEIVDVRPLGHGATQASAGMLAPFSEAREGPLLDLAIESLARFDSFVARLAAAHATPFAYQRTGTLDVAFEPAELEMLAARQRELAARGVEASLHDARSVRALEPQLASEVCGGLLIPLHGFVAALDFARALAAAARQHDAQIIERGHVRRISQGNGGVIIDTDRGRLTADAAVVAAGSWAGEIEIEGVPLRVPVKPIRGQLLQLTWNGPMPQRVIWSERCYVVPWPDRSVLVGATVEDVGFDERTTVGGIRGLMDAASELLPATASATFAGARAGLRPAAPDHLPIVGWSSVVPNVMFATGHYRNGILLAPLTAELVAGAMLDDAADTWLDLMAPGRFGL